MGRGVRRGSRRLRNASMLTIKFYKFKKKVSMLFRPRYIQRI